MIDLYTWKTPNGRKISIMLEETGLPYTVKPIDTSAGAQQQPEFLALSPNGKIPAILDHDTPWGPLSIFESGAVLTYLADKSGKFLSSEGPDRYSALAWLSWQIAGLGPMMGQLGFFTRQKERNEPAIARYTAEVSRLLRVLETRLEAAAYLAGAAYSIADIATYPWVSVGFSLLKDHLPKEALDLPATSRWLTAIGERPAVAKGMALPE
jgi:GST-like protein